MLFNVSLESLRIELPPMSPAGFRGQHPGPRCCQITVDGAPPNPKPAGGFGFSAAVGDEFDHPFTQIKAIAIHACELIRLCANLNTKMLNNTD